MKNDLLVSLHHLQSSAHQGGNDFARNDILKLKNAGVNSVEIAHKILLDKKSSAEIKMIVCWALGQLRNKSSIEPLLRLFESNNYNLIWEASKSIGFIGEKKATPYVLKILSTARNLKKRTAAVYILGQLRDRRAVKSLIDILGDPKENANLRGHAAEALGKISDKKAVQPLILALEDSKTEVRFWAAYALGELGDKNSLPALRIVAQKDKSRLKGYGPVKDEALDAIATISSG